MAKKTRTGAGRTTGRSAPRRTRAGTTRATPARTFLEFAASGFADAPGEFQVRVDVYVSLLDAMTDNFPIARSDITLATVPSEDPIGADSQGWGICLAGFAQYLAHNRPFYAFFDHRPAYTGETLDKPVSEIVDFLTAEVIEQSEGLGS